MVDATNEAAFARIEALESELADLRMALEPVRRGERLSSPEALSRRHMLGVAGAGVLGVVGAFAATSGTAAARPRDSQVVLNPGGTAVSVKDTTGGTTAAIGDGAADDTLAFQQHLDLVRDAGGGVVFVPQGRYKITATLSVDRDVHLIGEGNARNMAKGYTGTALSTLVSRFTGTLLDVVGDDASLQHLFVLNGGAHATNADPSVASIRIAAKNVTVADCVLLRLGFAALELINGSGGAHIVRNRIIATTQQGARTSTCHGIVLRAVPDSLIMNNDIAADGTALLSEGGGPNIISNNFIYNSTRGIVLNGQGFNVVASNRFDEHDRTAVVLDWGTRSNLVVGNAIYLNGVDASAPSEERSGILVWGNSNGISPPAANSIVGNAFSNKTHGTLARTQQHGVVLKSGSLGNVVSANSFYDQRTASILDQSGGANTVTANAILDEGA